MPKKSRVSKRLTQSQELESIQFNIDTASHYNNGANKKSFSIQDLGSIKPRSQAQRDVFESFFQDFNLLLKGSAGTGKTFIAMYLALSEVFKTDTPYKQVAIVRSTLPVRDIGFLPGSLDEKIEVYEQPYKAICDELFSFKNSYDNMKRSGYIRFISTSFIRGITLHDTIVVMDEVQNFTFDELRSTITRAGDNTRFILCGDTKQSDHLKSKDREALHNLEQILEMMTCFDIVNFTKHDIIRSELVKQFIIASEERGF